MWAPFRWDADYLRTVRPDYVVGEIAERNLIRVPPQNVVVAELAAAAVARGRERLATR